MIEIDTIYNEDCLVGMQRIPDGTVDAIITDLPYGTTACSWDSVIPFEPMWEQFKRVTKPNAAILLFGSEPFSSALRMSNIKDYRYDWIWIKNRGSNFANSGRSPIKEHEEIMLFCNTGKWTYNPQMQKRTGGGLERQKYGFKGMAKSEVTNYHAFDKSLIACTEERLPSSWQYFKTSCGEDHFHPTQKPVDLLRYLILTYTNMGGVVLDATIGSGTTAVAALMEHRHFIGFETDKGYYDKAVERIADLRRNPTLF